MDIVVDVKKAQARLNWYAGKFSFEKGELVDAIMDLDHNIVPRIVLKQSEYNMIKEYL